jgi:2-oxoglutarate dehydrogenase E2 component (dihydrolipoamide succinyltransferase)
MSVEVKVPPVGDSISEVVIGEWHKKLGEAVAVDEAVVALESEKSSFDVPAPSAGYLARILKQPGETAAVGEVIAVLEESAVAAGPVSEAPPAVELKPAAGSASSASTAAPGGSAMAAVAAEPRIMPAAARLLAETNIPPQAIQPTGPGGRMLKEDVQRAASAKVASETSGRPAAPSLPAAPPTVRVSTGRAVHRRPMNQIRRTIAKNLVEAQHNAALLTTFNECDMSAVMALRKQHQEAFQERHGVKLGIMSFFVKAAVDALQAFPAINAQIQGHDIVYHDYCDIGIAIGGGKGLVVPVLRNAEQMTFAQIEQAIGEFSKRAQSGQLLPDELKGGTFTISNGGVYGSLLSTPIVNPPQSGVLGMHAIQDRPVVREGQIVIRPMMYLALTYDHRIVDGREAVSFLKRIKDCVENPVRLMLEA